MRRGILLLFIGMCGCAMQKGASDRQDNLVALDFASCADSVVFNQIEFLPPPGYKLKKLDDHQFCEYRLTYKDESVLYLSTNIYDGSQLNARNRYEKGIKTYSVNRSMYDTIRNQGVQSDGKYWLEWINGSYIVGYINSQDSMKFVEAIKSIELKQ